MAQIPLALRSHNFARIGLLIFSAEIFLNPVAPNLSQIYQQQNIACTFEDEHYILQQDLKSYDQ